MVVVAVAVELVLVVVVVVVADVAVTVLVVRVAVVSVAVVVVVCEVLVIEVTVRVVDVRVVSVVVVFVVDVVDVVSSPGLGIAQKWSRSYHVIESGASRKSLSATTVPGAPVNRKQRLLDVRWDIAIHMPPYAKHKSAHWRTSCWF